jgi:hypothetical protein
MNSDREQDGSALFFRRNDQHEKHSGDIADEADDGASYRYGFAKGRLVPESKRDSKSARVHHEEKHQVGHDSQDGSYET